MDDIYICMIFTYAWYFTYFTRFFENVWMYNLWWRLFIQGICSCELCVCVRQLWAVFQPVAVICLYGGCELCVSSTSSSVHWVALYKTLSLWWLCESGGCEEDCLSDTHDLEPSATLKRKIKGRCFISHNMPRSHGTVIWKFLCWNLRSTITGLCFQNVTIRRNEQLLSLSHSMCHLWLNHKQNFHWNMQRFWNKSKWMETTKKKTA